MQNVKEFVETKGRTLFEIYENGSRDGLATKEALRNMQTVMEETPDSLRGPVFSEFLSILRDAGVEFSVQQFQERVA